MSYPNAYYVSKKSFYKVTVYKKWVKISLTYNRSKFAGSDPSYQMFWIQIRTKTEGRIRILIKKIKDGSTMHQNKILVIRYNINLLINHMNYLYISALNDVTAEYFDPISISVVWPFPNHKISYGFFSFYNVYDYNLKLMLWKCSTVFKKIVPLYWLIQIFAFFNNKRCIKCIDIAPNI